MKGLLILIFCVSCVCSSHGQSDTVVVERSVLEIARDPFGYLKFNPGTNDVTEGWIAFVDEIGRHYEEKLLTAQRHYIQLTPMLTSSENELADQLITSRTEFIISYLETKYKIHKQNIRVAGALYDKDVGAVEIRILDKEIGELTRNQRRDMKREAKRQKSEEDRYFKDSSCNDC